MREHSSDVNSGCREPILRFWLRQNDGFEALLYSNGQSVLAAEVYQLDPTYGATEEVGAETFEFFHGVGGEALEGC
jgi:hypothetical protein